MGRLGSTLSGLLRHRRAWADAMRAASPRAEAASGPATPLLPVLGFGSNPGELDMFTYVPAQVASRPALVVVLHGCGQTAAGYNDGAGWSALADRLGFVLLLPQQRKGNNAKTCFNWFLPGDTMRDKGEALSIRQMIERAARDHAIDPSRIFITGLSAGGAMTAAMLATYPELFAGGAILAGLPYGAARDVQGALDSMFQGRSRPAEAWGDLVRAASPHPGPWPKVSVWHGGADAIVKPVNAAELVKQWTDVHGLPPEPSRRDMLDGHPREVWCDAGGREVIESVAIGGMGHGAALHVGTGDMQGGQAAPFMLDVGVSSTHHIARFWGLLEGAPSATARPKAGAALDGEVLPPAPGRRPEAGRPDGIGPVPLPNSVPAEVQAIIQKAFRAAGLAK